MCSSDLNRNTMDGISMVQTAEGALNEVHAILQRMRELAVQAANGTYSDEDREKIQQEISELTEEISRIGETTEFNTKALIKGEDDKTGLFINDVEFEGGEDAYVSVTVSSAGVAATAYLTLRTPVTEAELADLDGKTITIGDMEFTFDIANAGFVAGSADYSQLLFDEIASQINNAQSTFTATADATGIAFEMNDVGEVYNGTVITDGKVDSTLEVTLQVGANKGQVLNVEIGDMRAGALGLIALPGEEGFVDTADVGNGKSTRAMYASLSMLTEEEAGNAISVIDEAISRVSTQRSKLGAIQNRLAHTTNNLGVSEENLTSSMSRIKDADMAYEMAQYTQQNVISQAATAMLAQANQRPQQVLQLLN